MIFRRSSAILLLTFLRLPLPACKETGKLGWLYAGIAGGVAEFQPARLQRRGLFAQRISFVLGNRYSHLQRELLLCWSGGATLNMIASTL